MTTDQIAVSLLGVLAVWLSQARGAAWRRWGCIFGLLGQPWWLYSSWRAGQWELLAIAALLTAAWLRGLWVHWLATRAQVQGSGLGTIQITPGTK